MLGPTKVKSRHVLEQDQAYRCIPNDNGQPLFVNLNNAKGRQKS